jgi:type IV pilus assembly protein PilC
MSFIAVAVGLTYYASTKTGRLMFDTLKLKLPLFGGLYRKTAISRFSRTLGLLTESGVGILESLDITKEVMANEVLGRVINDVRSSVESGQRIAEPLKISQKFPPDAVQMISTGEETGNLSQMLNKVADIYDIAINYTIKKLTTVIEPLFLAIMGCIIGFIMASLLLPMFDMIKILRH